MNFSEFVKVLYPYCGNGDRKTDFIIRITDKVMGGQPGRAHQDGGYQNPMRCKDDRTLLAYFNGERSISQVDASVILARIDKYKFENYLKSLCSDEAKKLLLNDLSPVNSTSSLEELCADLLETILVDLAKAQK